MDIRQYIAETERTYSYRLKSVVPLDDAVLDMIEKVIMKWQPFSMSKPKKTMFQSHPLDFPEVQNAEVWMTDIVLGLPIAQHIMRKMITDALHLPEKMMVVRGENEWSEIEQQKMLAQDEMSAEAAKNGMTRDALLNNENYEEATNPNGEDFYGDKANSRLLNYLSDVEKAKHEASKVEPKSALFKWMDMPDGDGEPSQDKANFNADIKDAPATGKAGGETAKGKARVSRFANLTDEGRVYRAPMKTAKGEAKVLTRDADDIRKEV